MRSWSSKTEKMNVNVNITNKTDSNTYLMANKTNQSHFLCITILQSGIESVFYPSEAREQTAFQCLIFRYSLLSVSYNSATNGDKTYLSCNCVIQCFKVPISNIPSSSQWQENYANTSSKIAPRWKWGPADGKTDIFRQKWIEQDLIDRCLS